MGGPLFFLAGGRGTREMGASDFFRRSFKTRFGGAPSRRQTVALRGTYTGVFLEAREPSQKGEPDFEKDIYTKVWSKLSGVQAWCSLNLGEVTQFRSSHKQANKRTREHTHFPMSYTGTRVSPFVADISPPTSAMSPGSSFRRMKRPHSQLGIT